MQSLLCLSMAATVFPIPTYLHIKIQIVVSLLLLYLPIKTIFHQRIPINLILFTRIWQFHELPATT